MFSWSSYFPIADTTWIFFIVLLMILFAPMVMNKLRIPHIVGMVLAGVLVGKFGLNILERDASFELFGQVGLYYIMFLAGLEMDMEGLWKNLRKVLVFSVLTFFTPFALVYFAGTEMMGYSRLATLLLCCIMSSNTLIAYPIVCKYGLQKHRSVTLSVGASMVALLLSLLSLSVIVEMVNSRLHPETGIPLYWQLAWMLLKLAIYCAAMIYIIPRVARWFLQRNSDAVTQFIFVLSILFLNAAITDFIGLEGIFGAFFAGLLLNRYIPRVSPLMGRIEFIGNAIFIPYFLIGVGMLINIGALFESWHTAYIVACMVVMGTVGKMLAGYAAGIGFRLPVSHGHMMFGLTSAHAAGSIAIILVGLRMEIAPGQYLVDSDMLNGVVMMILFTCVISSIITEKASRQIALEDLSTCEEKAADDEKMLLPLSFQGNLDTLVSTAILMRNERLNRGLIGLSVALDDDNVVRNQAAGKTLLERAEKAAGESDVRMQTQSRIATNIANGIMHAFKENNASEIVMGLHGQKTEGGGFWGNFLEDLFTELNRQIIMVTAKQPLSTIRRIQVAVPSRAEYEPGFHRWLDRLSRMSGNLDCRIQFHGKQNTLALISEYIRNTYPDIRADYTLMAHWNELPKLASQIHEDHLFVVVTARKSTVSYRTAFEKLPAELNQYFKQENLMIIFPDQYGEPMNVMSFAAPQKRGQMSAYTQIRDWMARQTQT
ncbi:MAG: cation:proton antiporter [Prevotellaceae bacterium]|nr:cation:proton antiporter [Prevotellaceae bacterium]MDY6131198.1 cation:proton antiporter [Prevotella sp.]